MPVKDKFRLEECFSDQGMYCSSLLLLMLDNFGPAVLEWEPEIVQEEVERISGSKVNALTSDKLNAALSVLQSNVYHKSLPAFTTINACFSSKYATPEAFKLCTLDDILWGCTEIQLIEGPQEFKDQGFTHPIRFYTGMMLEAEGVTKPPTLLGFAEFDTAKTDNQEITFVDDPNMSMAYMQRQEDEIDRMNKFVVANLGQLLTQFRKLPLANAQDFDTKVEVMLQNLLKKDQEDAA